MEATKVRDPQNVYYHATEKAYISDILETGLQRGVARAIYREQPRENQEIPAVYLFSSLEDAREFALDNYSHDYAILGVELAGEELEPDREYDVGVAFRCCESFCAWQCSIAEIGRDA